MKRIYGLLVFCYLTVSCLAQDAYHTDLESTFKTTYQIPLGEWLLYDNEQAILDNSGNYGGSFSVETAVDVNFTKVVRANIANAGNNPWDAGWNIRNKKRINKNDKVLMVFSIRAIGGKGKVNIFAENVTTFAKQAILTVDVGEDWTHYFVPFESTETFNVETMTLGFHLAHQAQTIEIGGFTAMNFANKVTLADLPNEVNNDQYDGFEADAPWRATAAENIDKFRKANLTITVKNTEGTPVKGADVAVKMLRHDFAFGSAVNADKIAGNIRQNNIYESKITNLDGKGHGFNWVVFENDLKWPAWEDRWLVSRPELVKAVQWLRERDILIRGHTLVWPGASNMPRDIQNNRTNLPFIRQRIDDHLESILTHPNIKGEIAEWDVLNEITTNRSLEEYFGNRDILADIFKKTRELDANTGLWLNDYVTISTNSKPGNGNY
ncbi:MAG: endo-1,4-beta-xylanase, partial [Bacteroidota bacterium]